MRAHCDALADIFGAATHHVQTQPVCRAVSHGVTVPPVFRAPRASRENTRSALGIADDTFMVLLTLGGGGNRWGFDANPHAYPDTVFVTTASVPVRTQHGNLVELPAQNGFYHPDLVAAADCVVGKLGYSTVSEVYSAGRPFGYVTRPSFRESAPLAAFVESMLPSIGVSAEDCMSGNWVGLVPRLLEMPPAVPPAHNGADAICTFLETLL